MSENTTKTTAKTNPDAAPAAPAAPEVVRVIVRRPSGVVDSHAWFGFNDWGRQIQFDEPVTMPKAAVDYFRDAQRVEHHTNAKGEMVPSYSAAWNIVDAPAQ